MRWSIIRTIWLREMRDQSRDRRTLFMIVGLPLVLYPLLGFAVLQFAAGRERPIVGVVTGSAERKDFPAREPAFAGYSVLPPISWLSLCPDASATAWIGPAALAQASHATFDYPQFIRDGRFTVSYVTVPAEQKRDWANDAPVRLVFLPEEDPTLLAERKVDLILVAPADFFAWLDIDDEAPASPRPKVTIRTRRDDERSRLAEGRINVILDGWMKELRKVRIARKGMTEQYLEPFQVDRPDAKGGGAATREEAIADLVIRVFPFMLVMWSLAGALYPAIDLCAGEKERGTMETLLITPAGREEIVLGKFLTIWVFSSGTALLNLISMGVATAMFGSYLPHGPIPLQSLLWCVVLSLPQSAFFSAISLAIGAYARSSKEGQYYLMPLFVITMPLIFLTLAPGVELNPLYSLVPVTGVALLMQKLMKAGTLGEVPWAYFVPVLAPIAIYSWLALRWAIEQFNREEVLFREAERLDPILWLKRLFRDKEPTPTTGQAFFCLGLVIGLRWLSMGIGNRWSLEMHTAISELAFVAVPPLFMVLLLNTRPGESLYLRWPRGLEAGLSVILVVLLVPVMAGLTEAVAILFPRLLDMTYPERIHPLIEILRAIRGGEEMSATKLARYGIAFALVPAICDELAFRGMILRGLHHGFRPRNAVFLSAFFFALFHMNVFLFVPTFLLGVVLGLLTVRSRSLLPAILFHFLHNGALIALIPLGHYSEGAGPQLVHEWWPWVSGGCLIAAAALVWWLYRKPYIDLARREQMEREQIERGR